MIKKKGHIFRCFMAFLFLCGFSFFSQPAFSQDIVYSRYADWNYKIVLSLGYEGEVFDMEKTGRTRVYFDLTSSGEIVQSFYTSYPIISFIRFPFENRVLNKEDFPVSRISFERGNRGVPVFYPRSFEGSGYERSDIDSLVEWYENRPDGFGVNYKKESPSPYKGIRRDNMETLFDKKLDGFLGIPFFRVSYDEPATVFNIQDIESYFPKVSFEGLRFEYSDDHVIKYILIPIERLEGSRKKIKDMSVHDIDVSYSCIDRDSDLCQNPAVVFVENCYGNEELLSSHDIRRLCEYLPQWLTSDDRIKLTEDAAMADVSLELKVSGDDGYWSGINSDFRVGNNRKNIIGTIYPFPIRPITVGMDEGLMMDSFMAQLVEILNE